MFDNPEIPLDKLPNASDPEWQPLDAVFVRRLQVERLIGLLVASLIVAAVTLIPLLPLPKGPLWGLLLAAAVPLMIWPSIAVRRRGYVLRDKDILFKSGVFLRSVTAIAFNRIQHVETSSAPLDRGFGLATLQLFTAGGSGADLKIEGLSQATAERLRSFVLEKTGASIEDA